MLSPQASVLLLVVVGVGVEGKGSGGLILSQWPPQSRGSRYLGMGLVHWMPEG